MVFRKLSLDERGEKEHAHRGGKGEREQGPPL